MHFRTHQRLGRAVALATVLLVAWAAAPAPVGAASVKGTAKGSTSVSTGSWGVTAAVTSMVFTSNTDQTSTVTNTGSIALTAESYAVTISNPVTGTPTFKVFQCSVAWASKLCSGGAGTQIGGTLAKNSTTTITSTTALASAAVIYLQVEPAAVSSSTTVTLVSKITSPTQLRAAVKTNQ